MNSAYSTIGAQSAFPGRQVISLSGDGGFAMLMGDFLSLKQLNLPVKVVVLDNGSHGMVRQFQESYLDGRYQSTVWGYSAPDFAEQPKVIDGASNLLVELFGDRGRHSRSAIGMGALPFGISVEIEMVVEIGPDGPAA